MSPRGRAREKKKRTREGRTIRVRDNGARQRIHRGWVLNLPFSRFRFSALELGMLPQESAHRGKRSDRDGEEEEVVERPALIHPCGVSRKEAKRGFPIFARCNGRRGKDGSLEAERVGRSSERRFAR